MQRREREENFDSYLANVKKNLTRGYQQEDTWSGAYNELQKGMGALEREEK
jgi:hypothetical protein